MDNIDAAVRVTIATIDGKVLEHFIAWPSSNFMLRAEDFTTATTAASIRELVVERYKTEERER